mgnify:CR=1 FL=1
MNLCINCKYYVAGADETEDECRHEKAFSGGVRKEHYYKCGPMVAGICEKNKLFEPATLGDCVKTLTNDGAPK